MTEHRGGACAAPVTQGSANPFLDKPGAQARVRTVRVAPHTRSSFSHLEMLLLASILSSIAAHVEIRALLAAGLNVAAALLLGRRVIALLGRRYREANHSPSADIQRLQAHKRPTPTMGGLAILAAIGGSLLLLADWHGAQLPIVLLATFALGGIGLADDLVKLRGARRGLAARTKFAAQLVVAAIAAAVLYHQRSGVPGGLSIDLTFGLGASSAPVDLGYAWIGLAVLVIVGSSNAVNLTDGLDGLAGGCLAVALTALGVIAYLSGAGELAVAAAAAVGALLGFLWFNCHPAAIFMGDTGSLSLGGLLGLLALALRQELLLLVLGGVFVAEAASVILQVASFRWTGRRVFLCAPLHHHFQLRGWPERQIVRRFWIAATLCAACGLGIAACSLPTPHENAADRRSGIPVPDIDQAQLDQAASGTGVPDLRL